MLGQLACLPQTRTIADALVATWLVGGLSVDILKNWLTSWKRWDREFRVIWRTFIRPFVCLSVALSLFRNFCFEVVISVNHHCQLGVTQFFFYLHDVVLECVLPILKRVVKQFCYFLQKIVDSILTASAAVHIHGQKLPPDTVVFGNSVLWSVSMVCVWKL